MSTNVIEVSQGIPVEGRRFEVPPVSQDHQKPRYVTFLGNLIDREAAANKEWTKGGGVIIANPCLKYAKNFLRKGRITPVLKDTHDYRPLDLQKRASEGDTSYFPQPIPVGYVAPQLPEGAGPAKHGYMVGKMVLPGEQITAITEGSAAIAHGGMRRGVVEITSLKGQEYNDIDFEFNGQMIHTDKTIWEIQRAIFPNYPFVPPLIEDVGRAIQSAKQHTMIREIVDNFELSWEQFREYANVTIRHTHMQMREIAGASHGYIPTYTALDLILLEQLGLARQDEEIRKNAAPTTDPELQDMFKQFMALQIEEKLEAKARRERIEVPPIDANTMAAAPIAEQTDYEAYKGNYPEFGETGYPGQSGYSGYSGEITAASSELPSSFAVSDYLCECGKSFGKPQGLSMHKSQHCPLREQKTEE